MNTHAATPKPVPNRRLSLSFDLRWLTAALALVIAGMLLLWKPWSPTPAANARTITVIGDTTLRATPDEYIFAPSYAFKNSDKAAAIESANAKSTEVVAKLKSLGVAEKQIKTSIDGYQDAGYPKPLGVSQPADGSADGDYIYTFSATITVSDKSLAQKIQDYLAGTGPTGSVTAAPAFSQARRKQLESQARDAAARDARSKADQSARNLGFKVGGIKSVEDGSGFNSGPVTIESNLNKDKPPVQSQSISLQPGENELSYSVTVVYYIK